MTTMEIAEFPAKTTKIHASQDNIPNLKDESSKRYTSKITDGVTIFYKNNKIIVDKTLFHKLLE